MLQESKHSKNDVVTVKLLSGEELIGYFVEETDKGVTLRKPVVPIATGEQSMGLAPFIMSADTPMEAAPLTLRSHSVSAVVSTSAAFKKAYVQQMSGLVV